MLNECEINIWSVCLDRAPGQVRTLYHSLSTDEKCRAANFRVESDRDGFIVARGSLRRILGRYLSLRADQVCFSYSQHGKPSLDHDNIPLRFNVTHSRGLAFVAVARGREVGVDLEFVDESFAFMKTARTVFSATEYSWLQALKPSSRADAFFRCWTRKEALLKAVGTGFSQKAESKEARNWTVADLPVAAAYKAAVAVEGPIDSIRFRSENSPI